MSRHEKPGLSFRTQAANRPVHTKSLVRPGAVFGSDRRPGLLVRPSIRSAIFFLAFSLLLYKPCCRLIHSTFIEADWLLLCGDVAPPFADTHDARHTVATRHQFGLAGSFSLAIKIVTTWLDLSLPATFLSCASAAKASEHLAISLDLFCSLVNVGYLSLCEQWEQQPWNHLPKPKLIHRDPHRGMRHSFASCVKSYSPKEKLNPGSNTIRLGRR